MKTSLLLAGALLLAAPAAARAQEKPPVPAVVTSVVTCRTQTDEAARLRCYDAAAAALAEATANGSLLALDKEAVRKTRRSLFGFDIPNLPFFRDKDDADAPKEIVAKVASVRAAGFENWLMTLDNGAMWQTTEATPKVPMPRAGDEVRFVKGVTGSYMVQVGSRRIRARRVR